MSKTAGYFNQKGALSLLLLIAALGLIVFIIVTSTFSFQNNFFSSLYEKEESEAAITNLVYNPGCEQDTTGWGGFNATLTWNTNQHYLGKASCKLSFSPGISPQYGMRETAWTQRYPPYGTIYSASALVKTNNNSSVGKPVRIRLLQSGGSTPAVYTSSNQIPLSTSWQKISVSTTINASGRTKLELSVQQENAVSGNTLFVDTIKLFEDGSVLSPTPTPTLTSINVGGYVYIDSNSNKTRDTGESGLSGSVVSLSTGANSTTDSSGQYSFVIGADGNTYQVSHQPPTGYTNTSPTSVNFTANTNFYYDFGVKPIISPTPSNIP